MQQNLIKVTLSGIETRCSKTYKQNTLAWKCFNNETFEAKKKKTMFENIFKRVIIKPQKGYVLNAKWPFI